MAITPDSTIKTERLNIRTTQEEKQLVEEAARLTHVSASQFVLRAALHSAEDVLVDQNRFVLPPERMRAFVDLLDRPARAIPALTEAASKPSPFSAA
jgi:uncharacterized protein (DUF1778 family)